jgi:hypothetical protein
MSPTAQNIRVRNPPPDSALALAVETPSLHTLLLCLLRRCQVCALCFVHAAGKRQVCALRFCANIGDANAAHCLLCLFLKSQITAEKPKGYERNPRCYYCKRANVCFAILCLVRRIRDNVEIQYLHIPNSCDYLWPSTAAHCTFVLIAKTQVQCAVLLCLFR